MKSIYDIQTADELIQRIHSLQETAAPSWGRMTVGQMVRHCAQWDEMAQGKTIYRQSLLGKLFGRMAKSAMMKDEPMKKNMPTVPAFVIKDQPDLATEKASWIRLVGDYANSGNEGFVHPFFGWLPREQAGVIAYKHADHHLRQFGV